METIASSVGLVDSECSNHITGNRSLFINLDESQKVSVRLGNEKEMMVQGVGTMSINT